MRSWGSLARVGGYSALALSPERDRPEQFDQAEQDDRDPDRALVQRDGDRADERRDRQEQKDRNHVAHPLSTSPPKRPA